VVSRFFEFRCGHDLEVIGDEIGFFSILEIQLDILQECGLVAFDGEVVMGLPILDQVMGEVALGQEGIGVISLPSISMASSRGMAILISLVCFNSHGPLRGECPLFLV